MKFNMFLIRFLVVVHFVRSFILNQTISIPPPPPPPSATSTSLLTTSSTASLSFPLIAEKPGASFKFLILFLSLLIALIIGFILSLVFVTQFIHVPTRTSPSPGLYSTVSEQNAIQNNYRFEQFHSTWIDQLDFNVDVCEDFYNFVCGKWLINHPLSPLEFKRSWLTERSHDIREKFARILANLSDIHAYNQTKINQTEQVTSEIDIDDTSANDELEHFYASHDDDPHKLVKRQLDSNSNDLSRSISNMLLYYHQCLHTSESVLLEQLHHLAYDRFWFTNNYEIISTNHHFDFLFEQMTEHPLMRIWNINTINLGTQVIIHIQRRIQNQEKISFIHQVAQASLFEDYLRTNQIDLCYQSSRVGRLSNTLKEYNELLISLVSISSNSSINDDLHRLIIDQEPLSIIYSSIKYSHELKDLIQFMLDKNMIQALNNTEIYQLFVNFTHDLEISLSNIPIFRSTIAYQCQLYLNYYIRIRSLDGGSLERWFDYISSSIIQLIVQSWPGDASYACLYSTIVRHHQFEAIPYWNRFVSYAKKQIKDVVSPMVTVEIRLIDFFQLDSIFRFLFADQYAHYCNLMVYKYGPKLLPFVSVFHEGIQFSLKNLWKQTLQKNSKEQLSTHSLPLSSYRIPNDCLTLLEYYYPFTLSSYYEEYMSNKTSELYSIVYELRDILLNNSNHQYLSSLQFHIKPERLKLFYELSPTSSHIPYEYYFIEDNYLSTAWNIIENSHEQFVEPIHEFFEINGHHTIEQGIFLQPTVGELYSNESTRLVALLLIAHELGHAICPCGINQTEREFFADLIAIRLIINYNEQKFNQTVSSDLLKQFFLIYGQSECMHINREMISLMNRQENSIEFHVNRVLKGTEQFQILFNCSLNQRRQTKRMNSLLPRICSECRRKKNSEN